MDRRSFLALSGATAATLLTSSARVSAETLCDDSPIIGVQRGIDRRAVQLRLWAQNPLSMPPVGYIASAAAGDRNPVFGVSIAHPTACFQVASTAMAEDMLLANIAVEAREPVPLENFSDVLALGCVINRASNRIALRSMRGKATCLLMNKAVYGRIMRQYWPTYTKGQLTTDSVPLWGPPQHVSKGRWQAVATCSYGQPIAIYCSDCLTPDQIVAGYKVAEWDAAGVISESEPGRFYPLMRDTDYRGSFEDYFYKFPVRI